MSSPGPDRRRRQLPGGRSLTLQLLLFAVLPLAVLLIVIAFGSLGLHSQAMRDLVAEREARASHAAGDAITEQLRQRGLLIQSLAALAAQAPGPQAALEAAGHLTPDFEGGLAILSDEGRVLASTTPPEQWDELDLTTALQRSRASGRPEFSATWTSSLGGVPELAVVFAAEGQSAAGLFQTRDIAGSILDDAFPPESQARVWLVDSELRPLYRRQGTPLEFDLVGHPDFEAARQGTPGVAFLDLQGVEYVAALEPVPPLGWVLVMEEPWESADNPLLRQTQLAPLVLIPALLLAVLALAFAVRQIAQPLQALERKSAEVGRGDLQALQDPVGGVEEIKSLQRTMVQMAQRLRAYEQSVRRYAGAVTRSQEDERRRVARELHDETIQALIALDQRIQLAQKAIQRDTENAAGHLTELRQMTQGLLGGLRRIIGALRPIYLEDLGLPSALQMLAEDAAASGQLDVGFASTGSPKRLSPEVEIAVYRIAQEALANVTRHSAARTASMTLGFEADRLVLTIEDNGVGFAMPDPDVESASGSHYGLIGMRERAELIHARLTIRSTPGSGTTVQLEIPD